MKLLKWLGFAMVLAACGEAGPLVPGDGSGDPTADRAADPGGGKADAARLRQCLGRFTPSPSAGWRHWKSRLISALGSPVHSASDVVARPGAAGTVSMKLAYGGVLSKDLEDEWVWIFVDDCTRWRYAGYALTNDDGRATFKLPSDLPAGVYDVRVEVVGDATVLPLRMWVLPSGTHLAVFDIDGTLTTSDGELVQEILTGADPDAYPAASDVVQAETARDEVVVYLTSRPYILTSVTRGWLDRQGFPAGVVNLSPSAGGAIPTNSGAGDYKADYLAGLRAAGYRLDDAFGNASTDIYAYARSGISTSRTWIIGDNAGDGGTIGVHDSWQDVATQLFLEPPVSQPGF